MASSKSALVASLVLLLALAGIVLGARDVKEQQHVYPISKPCKMNFSSIDYSSVTSVCKSPDYNEKECCGAFTAMACKYSQHVNDYSTSCPIEFVSFLNYAGSYPHGVFIGRCNNDGQHLLCAK
eukprot:Gb_28525 [translate_table: standard]